MRTSARQRADVHLCQEYLAYLREHPGATALQVAMEHFGRDDRTAMHAAFDNLRALQRAGLVLRIRRGRKHFNRRSDAWIALDALQRAKAQLLAF